MPSALAPHQKLLRNIRRAFRRPIEGYRDYQALLAGKRVLEVGGPTKLFRRDLPVYRVAASVDGVNFAAQTMWEGRLVEGPTYRYDKGRVGHQYICDATDLSRLPAEGYDAVLSCNNLEHIANPLKALHEWLRVLRPGGHLLLVLPRRESNFDRLRDVTPFAHLVDDFERGTGEDDLTHLDEIVERNDYAQTPDVPDRESLRAQGLRNLEVRGLHHHVFDMALIEQMFDHLGLSTLLRTTIPSDHIALARKP